MTTWIDVKVPYESNDGLAIAYNRAMKTSKAKWVLLLDHDVFLACNPHWYDMCLHVVNTVDNSVGMITCVTYGRNGFDLSVANTSDLNQHLEWARELYGRHHNTLIEAENHRRAGFFMLVRKEAWQRVRFRDMGQGVDKIDHDFCRRLIGTGHKIMIMRGLYVMHRRGIRKLNYK